MLDHSCPTRSVTQVCDAAASLVGGRDAMEDRESAGAPHGEPGITSEERLRLIEENVRDYAMFTFGPDRRISGWSRGAERILGYTEAEILGHSADLVFVPEDRQQDIPELEMQEAA